MAALRWRELLFGPWLWLLAGCASASNADWLREPEQGLSAAGERLSGSQGAHTLAPVSDAPPVRPRLRHTVTLGETTSGGLEPSAPAAAPTGAPASVTVNNYVTVPAPTYGGWTDPRPSRAAPPQGQPAKPAGSWPSPPSYGPSFPFKSGPASPWR